jgi:hypothetical protein
MSSYSYGGSGRVLGAGSGAKLPSHGKRGGAACCCMQGAATPSATAKGTSSPLGKFKTAATPGHVPGTQGLRLCSFFGTGALRNNAQCQQLRTGKRQKGRARWRQARRRRRGEGEVAAPSPSLSKLIANRAGWCVVCGVALPVL